MILDMNIKLEGIDEEFLEEFDELIEETRVEYYFINPTTKEEIEKTQELCEEYERFKYSIPAKFYDLKDKNCLAVKIESVDDLALVTEELPIVIDSSCLDDSFIETLNTKKIKGVVLDSKESDNRLENFAYAVSYDSIKDWTNKGMMDTDFNKLALQSNYPKYDYDHLLDVLLKEMSDMTFRAEQSIASGGTRTLLKMFKLL